MNYNDILEKISCDYTKILQDNLVGIYVHGSIAFGCFRWERSDIDFLVVTKKVPALEERMALLRTLLELEACSPPKGLEMSLVLEKDCQKFTYPTPYFFHYSNIYTENCKKDPEGYCKCMVGTDKDLAAHFTVVKAVGITLVGKEKESVFGEVPGEAYLDSIQYDIENAPEEIQKNPVYMILNLCRVNAYMQNGLVLSKEQGGEWGLENLPKTYAPLISAAATYYRQGTPFNAEPEQMQKFAEYMKKRIFT